jgi:hypothetical protein
MKTKRLYLFWVTGLTCVVPVSVDAHYRDPSHIGKRLFAIFSIKSPFDYLTINASIFHLNIASFLCSEYK